MTNDGPRPRMGGMIGVISQEMSRFADFSIALIHLQKPAGARLAWAKGVDVAGNCNKLVRAGGDWLWLLGDDHVFDPDILLRLLAHDVDIVVPLCLQRRAPFDPVVYGEADEFGRMPVADLPATGLVEVFAAGSAGMLIRRRVFDAIPAPVFEAFGEANEDINFCRKAREAGFAIWCDVDARLGHIGLVRVWPEHDGNEWSIDLDLGGGQRVGLQRLVEVPPPDLVEL